MIHTEYLLKSKQSFFWADLNTWPFEVWKNKFLSVKDGHPNKSWDLRKLNFVFWGRLFLGWHFNAFFMLLNLLLCQTTTFWRNDDDSKQGSLTNKKYKIFRIGGVKNRFFGQILVLNHVKSWRDQMWFKTNKFNFFYLFGNISSQNMYKSKTPTMGISCNIGKFAKSPPWLFDISMLQHQMKQSRCGMV